MAKDKEDNILQMNVRRDGKGSGTRAPAPPIPGAQVQHNLKRKDLAVKCTKEEFESMRLIRNRVICAQQVLNPRMVPQEGVTEDQVRLFVKGAIEAKAEAMFLEQDWWYEMNTKYKLPDQTHLDLITGGFYQIINLTKPTDTQEDQDDKKEDS